MFARAPNNNPHFQTLSTHLSPASKPLTAAITV